MSEPLFTDFYGHTDKGVWMFYSREDCDGVMFKYLGDQVLGVWIIVEYSNGVQPDHRDWEHQGNFKFKKGQLDIANLDLKKAHAMAVKKGLVS